MREKLRSTGGLTMVETLCAVVILILLCLMINTGIELTVKNYYALTSESETELLLVSLCDALADKLRYTVVTKEEGGSLSWSIGDVTVDDGKVKVNGEPLLPDGAYGDEGRYLAEPGDSSSGKIISYDEATNCFQIDLKVTVKPTAPGYGVYGSSISQSAKVSVRCLNPLRTE